jgi:hypothetical protein
MKEDREEKGADENYFRGEVRKKNEENKRKIKKIRRNTIKRHFRLRQI